MNGIAISVYDKFEEVGVLVDIIRNNWEDDYYITLCSNYPDAKKNISNLDVDKFIQGADIKFNPSMPWKPNGRTNLVCRVLDTIKKSCSCAIEEGCDYVMHLHSDAWPLDEKSFVRLVEDMQRKKKKVAVRGFGFAYYGHDAPLGSIDDMFFLFNSAYFKETSFFDYNPLDLFPHKHSPHGALVLLLLGKIGIKNIYLYSDYSNLEYWDGKNKVLPFERAKPSVFDPNLKFLHVHVGAFPNDLGKSIQAHYLKTYDVIKGSNIESFIDKHYIPEEELFSTLEKAEKKQDLKLRLLGYNPVVFGRDFSSKDKVLNLSATKKAKLLIKNVGYNAYCKLTQKSNIQTRELYPDNLWPNQSLDQFYKKMVIETDFPEEYRDFWFSNW